MITTSFSRSFRRVVFDWVAPMAAGVAGCIVFWLLLRPPPIPSGTQLPSVGHAVHAGIRAHVPNGGTILFVSDYCPACRSRARSFVRYLENHSHLTLIVAEDSTAPYFRPMVTEREPKVGRAVFAAAQDLARFGVRYFPSTLTVDREGRVTAAGRCTIGRLQAGLNPVTWVKSWYDFIAGFRISIRRAPVHSDSATTGTAIRVRPAAAVSPNSGAPSMYPPVVAGE